MAVHTECSWDKFNCRIHQCNIKLNLQPENDELSIPKTVTDTRNANTISDFFFVPFKPE